MSWNLANRPADERQAMEDEKARLFEFWQQNLEREGRGRKTVRREVQAQSKVGGLGT